MISSYIFSNVFIDLKWFLRKYMFLTQSFFNLIPNEWSIMLKILLIFQLKGSQFEDKVQVALGMLKLNYIVIFDKQSSWQCDHVKSYRVIYINTFRHLADKLYKCVLINRLVRNTLICYLSVTTMQIYVIIFKIYTFNQGIADRT